MTTDEEQEERPVAWTAIEQSEPVLSSDGEKLGEIEEVLGTGENGVFHGIVVKPHLLADPVEVPAAQVGAITNRSVILTIDKPAFDGLPPYQAEPSFTLGIRGIFRHRPGWVPE